MKLVTKLLNYILVLLGALTRRLTLYANSSLTYLPAGWDTPMPVGDDTGWNHTGVSKLEQEKWQDFCVVISGCGPMGFSHENMDMTVTDDVFFHNVNITFGYVLARLAHQKSSLSILDYGGGLGHFYHIGKALLPEVDLHYSCKELPHMAACGTELNAEISWFVDDSCLKAHYDLIMISGSLQYIPHWQQFLSDIASATVNHVFITRVPVVNKAASFVSIQQAYGSRMLHWHFNRSELIAAFEQAGFTIVREFLAGDCPYIKRAPEQCDLRGWLLQKKAQEAR